VVEKFNGPEHPNFAASLEGLASIYEAQGRYIEAEDAYKRTLAINEKHFGQDHPQVATTLNYLVGLYLSQRRYVEAEPLLKKALEIGEKHFGSDHPEVVKMQQNYANVMKKMGKAKFIKDNDAFRIAEDNLYLVGSAEHSIGPLHMEHTFEAQDLPRRYVGFSTSFRREAGSYGKDTKGILRVHQFDKVELFSFTPPRESEEEHQFLLMRQEELLQALELPYRVMQICTGDMGFGDYKQYDIETWLPGQGRYRETHSCSNTTDFQARGLRAKWRNPETGKSEFVHTLNATGFAMTRMIIAILENYQQPDGSVLIPKALQGYMGKDRIGKL